MSAISPRPRGMEVVLLPDRVRHGQDQIILLHEPLGREGGIEVSIRVVTGLQVVTDNRRKVFAHASREITFGIELAPLIRLCSGIAHGLHERNSEKETRHYITRQTVESTDVHIRCVSNARLEKVATDDALCNIPLPVVAVHKPVIVVLIVEIKG